MERPAYPAESSLFDAASRSAKAAKIRAVLDVSRVPLEGCRVLDIGCGSGLIAGDLAADCAAMIGLEISRDSLRWARTRSATGDVLWVQGAGEYLPLADACVDLVICAQVYEHVSDARRMAQEIWRVLVPGGVCFFSGPNRLEVVEPHYGLPFLGWLPPRWADAWVRRSGLGERYDARPVTWWTLRRLWHRFGIEDVTVQMLKRPDDFHLGDAIRRRRLLRYLPDWVLRALAPAYPNYNWILRKNPEAR